MLQAPTNDRKTKAEASSKTAEHLPEYEQSSQLMGGIGRSRESQPLQQRENLAALQKVYGNQAVLRMKGRSPAVNPVQGRVLQRKCACGNSAGSSGSCAECQSKQEGILQTKLQIGEVGDRYEQEADRVAEQVMQMPEALIQHPVKPEAISNSITLLQSRSSDQDQLSEVPPIVHEVLRSPGQPLSQEALAFIEPHFGQDFSQVRVHTNVKAEQSAREVNALAYTVGRDVVFAKGQYAPKDMTGKRLLVHELTHVLQQQQLDTRLQRQNADEENNNEFENIGDELEEEVIGIDEEDSVSELKSIPKPKKPKPTKNPCTRTIFSEGTCQFLVLNAGGRCCDPDNGIENSKRTKDVEGKPCPDQKFTPLFTCDHDCPTALDKGCNDSDNWMAIPKNQFSTKQCGDIFTICANGRKTTGYVRDKSVTQSRFEVSPGIQQALGVTVGQSFKGAIFRPGVAQNKIDTDPCCKGI